MATKKCQANQESSRTANCKVWFWLKELKVLIKNKGYKSLRVQIVPQITFLKVMNLIIFIPGTYYLTLKANKMANTWDKIV